MYCLPKNRLQILLLALIFALSAFACSDDDEDSPTYHNNANADVVSDDADNTDDAVGADVEEDAEEVEEVVEEKCLTMRAEANLILTNEARAEEGLGALECDKGLMESAFLHAKDMCDHDYFSHDSIDGRDLSDRVNAAGVQWNSIGENIAYGQSNAAEVHEAWMNSPGHRANILTEGFGRIGIGYFLCQGRPYWVQNFAN